MSKQINFSDVHMEQLLVDLGEVVNFIQELDSKDSEVVASLVVKWYGLFELIGGSADQRVFHVGGLNNVQE